MYAPEDDLIGEFLALGLGNVGDQGLIIGEQNVYPLLDTVVVALLNLSCAGSAKREHSPQGACLLLAPCYGILG